MAAPRLAARDLQVRLEGQARRLLRGLGLSVEAGEVVGLTGRSGSGKTTLLHTLAGLAPWLRPAEVAGAISVNGESVSDLDPGQRAHLMAVCLDRPESQLFLHTPRQELAGAARLHPDSALAELVVSAFGLEPLLDRRITELSSGERQRVALAATLTGSPRPVLLDEPSAHLDGNGVAALQSLLGEVRADGGAVLLSEQAGWRLGAAPQRWLDLDQGVLTRCGAPAAPVVPGAEHTPTSGVALRCRALEVGRGDSFRVRVGELEVRRGEVVLLTGPNGAGKTTLAQVLAGLRRPVEGWVSRIGRVALMLPDADLQLFAPTVAAELASVGASGEESARVLRRHRLEHLAARAPWQLSRGERQRLVHAVLDLLRPAVLVVDEPGQGLHGDDLVQLVQLIHRRAAKGRAYVIISHRRELEAAVHRHLEIRDARVVEAG